MELARFSFCILHSGMGIFCESAEFGCPSAILEINVNLRSEKKILFGGIYVCVWGGGGGGESVQK